MKITSFLYDTTYMPSAPVITIQVRDRKEVRLTALVDSGADATMIPINILRSIGAHRVDTMQMRGITGVAQPVGLYSVMIQISSHILPSIHVIATARGSEVIPGRDVLNHLIITLNGLAGVTEIEI